MSTALTVGGQLLGGLEHADLEPGCSQLLDGHPFELRHDAGEVRRALQAVEPEPAVPGRIQRQGPGRVLEQGDRPVGDRRPRSRGAPRQPITSSSATGGHQIVGARAGAGRASP